VTRFAADLLENAAAEGARQRRSAREQLDHWARIGCAASSRHSAARRKVEAALASELELAELGVEQGAVFNAEISRAIQGFIVGSRPRRPGHPADRLDLDDGWDDHWLPPVGLPHPLADRTAHRLGDAGRICNLF